MEFAVIVALIVVGLAVLLFVGGLYFSRSATYSPVRADQLLPTVERLLSDYQTRWDEILEFLNPRNDHEVHQLLMQIRNGKQFNPHLGIGVIETGFRNALKANSMATLKDALLAAIKSDDTINTHGDRKIK